METEEGNISAVVHVRKAGTVEMVVLGRVVPGNDKTVDSYRGVLEVHTNTEKQRVRTIKSRKMLHEIVKVLNDVAVGTFRG